MPPYQLVAIISVPARKRKRRRQDYKRWQREEPMQLWQLDVTGSVFLADGTELKLVSGIDDHSRFCVIAAVARRATPALIICRAFLAAMRTSGIPDEVLTGNGKQFTGRYGKPRPAEVLSERIYRKNGIKQLLTKPRSPPATGKVERWHQTLQTDFLDDAGPFATIAAAQAAVDAWRQEYNTARPHQGPVVNGTGRRCVPVPVVTMCLTSTLCLLGEWGPDQAALRKRSASAQPGEPVAAGEARTAA